ncbi:MAG: hypothetical protein QOH05_3397 [Acetobacteraceae bacterium]|nr:hypothetical protein [Acetobacteraceae bacterium]
MDSFANVVNNLLHLLIQLGDFIVGALITIELWVRGQLAQMGLAANVQTVIMLAVAALLIVGALRLFGGLIRIAVVLVLILVAIHIVLPVLPH